MEEVTTFCFLGALIEKEEGCEKEMRRRVTLGRAATEAMEKYRRTTC